MTGHLTLILQLTYWHFEMLFPWMRNKVNFIRALHEMSGIPKNNSGLSQTHWQDKQNCFTFIFTFRIIFQNHISVISYSLSRYYQCFNVLSIHANNFQTFNLLLMRCFLYYVIKLLTLLGLQLLDLNCAGEKYRKCQS